MVIDDIWVESTKQGVANAIPVLCLTRFLGWCAIVWRLQCLFDNPLEHSIEFHSYQGNAVFIFPDAGISQFFMMGYIRSAEHFEHLGLRH